MHCFFDIFMIWEISKMLNDKFSVLLSFLYEFFMIFFNKFFFLLFDIPLKVLSDASFRPLFIKYRTPIDAFVIIYFNCTAIIAEFFSTMTCHEITAFAFFNKSAAPRTLFDASLSHFLFYLYLINVL
jgi:hypothetical protein